jgi:hypothetical protein
VSCGWLCGSGAYASVTVFAAYADWLFGRGSFIGEYFNKLLHFNTAVCAVTSKT